MAQFSILNYEQNIMFIYKYLLIKNLSLSFFIFLGKHFYIYTTGELLNATYLNPASGSYLRLLLPDYLFQQLVNLT